MRLLEYVLKVERLEDDLTESGMVVSFPAGANPMEAAQAASQYLKERAEAGFIWDAIDSNVWFVWNAVDYPSPVYLEVRLEQAVLKSAAN